MHIYVCHLSADSQGSCLLSITGLTVGSRSPGEVLSVLFSLLSFHQERQFYLCWALPAVTLYVYLCVSGDGVGFWGISCITAISRPDGSFVRGFVVWLF